MNHFCVCVLDVYVNICQCLFVSVCVLVTSDVSERVSIDDATICLMEMSDGMDDGWGNGQ